MVKKREGQMQRGYDSMGKMPHSLIGGTKSSSLFNNMMTIFNNIVLYIIKWETLNISPKRIDKVWGDGYANYSNLSWYNEHMYWNISLYPIITCVNMCQSKYKQNKMIWKIPNKNIMLLDIQILH